MTLKISNEYAQTVSYYARVPKAVFAAVAVSSLTCGGDFLSESEERFAREWWILYRNGIVPQRPHIPDPGDA